MKPWLSEPRGRQLEAFVGVWNIHTSNFNSTTELLVAAGKLFEIDAFSHSVESAAEEIEGLGKKIRAMRARANRHLLVGAEETPPKAADTPVTEEGLAKMMAGSKPQTVDGASQDCIGELDIDPAKLLLKVVSAVIGAGQAHILYDFPEVLEFTKSRIPSRAELAGHTNTDERMFEAKAKWPNLIPGTQI